MTKASSILYNMHKLIFCAENLTVDQRIWESTWGISFQNYTFRFFKILQKPWKFRNVSFWKVTPHLLIRIKTRYWSIFVSLRMQRCYSSDCRYYSNTIYVYFTSVTNFYRPKMFFSGAFSSLVSVQKWTFISVEL